MITQLRIGVNMQKLRNYKMILKINLEWLHAKNFIINNISYTHERALEIYNETILKDNVLQLSSSYPKYYVDGKRKKPLFSSITKKKICKAANNACNLLIA